MIKLWKDKDKEIIDPELFSKKAEELAKILANENRTERKNPNKASQIRKFYDEVLKLETQARTKSIKKEQILPLVHMLIAKAAYAKGRDLVSDTFLNFIKDSVNQIKDTKDLKVFVNFFEALMGFYKQHGPKN